MQEFGCNFSILSDVSSIKKEKKNSTIFERKNLHFYLFFSRLNENILICLKQVKA